MYVYKYIDIYILGQANKAPAQATYKTPLIHFRCVCVHFQTQHASRSIRMNSTSASPSASASPSSTSSDASRWNYGSKFSSATYSHIHLSTSSST